MVIKTTLKKWKMKNNIKLCQCQNKDTTELFWIEVYSFKNSLNGNPFIKLSTFVINLFSLPFCKAKIEKAFCVMNFRK